MLHELEKLLAARDWHQLIKQYRPSQVAQEIGFKKCLELSYDIFFDHAWNDDFQDGFLAMLNLWTRNYDGRYEAIKRAYDKTQDDPPPQVLYMLAECMSCPGDPPLSSEQAIEYLKRALKKEQYSDVVFLLRCIYKHKKDKKNEEYWQGIHDQIKESAPETPHLVPDWLVPRAQFLTNADKIKQSR